MKTFVIVLFSLMVGTAIGSFATDYSFRTKFEEMSGVNWYSFEAAGKDCEVAFKEDCKIHGGYAPKSMFR